MVGRDAERDAGVPDLALGPNESLRERCLRDEERVRDGEQVVTDGPFAETKEVLGGYFLADCKDLDQAIELAQRIPLVDKGSVEIRPLASQ